MLLLQGAITGLKTAADIAIGLNKLNTMAEVNAKAIDLQQVILSAQSSALSAQSEQFSILERIRELEEELTRVKAWETQRQRYQMTSPFTGAMVYALKKSMSDGEPAHYICANCYQQGERSILQNKKDKDGRISFICPVCKTEALTRHRMGISAKYAEDVITEE